MPQPMSSRKAREMMSLRSLHTGFGASCQEPSASSEDHKRGGHTNPEDELVQEAEQRVNVFDWFQALGQTYLLFTAAGPWYVLGARDLRILKNGQ